MEKQTIKGQQYDPKHVAGKSSDAKHPDNDNDPQQFKKNNDPSHHGKENILKNPGGKKEQKHDKVNANMPDKLK